MRASNPVVLGMHWGAYPVPLRWRLYLRASTVRRINQKRQGQKTLRYLGIRSFGAC